MPTHNRVDLLKKAVESVLGQTYQNFKLVIVNDGSSDGTQEYLELLNDERISFIQHNSPMGACRSRNDAIRSLDTELITGLDDDDIFLPNRLEELLSVYDEKFSFVCSGYFWDYGAHKKALFKDSREISLSDAFDLNQCSNQILVNRERALAVGGFDESLPALQDHDLWIRLIAEFGTAYRLGKPSYVVNDDRSFERISSRTNKLNAIAIFEKKHDALMSDRNKENFIFYKRKVQGDSFTFSELIKSRGDGLLTLKFRQFFSKNFKSLSLARLSYLRTGSFFYSFLEIWKGLFSLKGGIFIFVCIIIFSILVR
ncbi:glycosyltransferase [Colwellia sp. RSH04]|uniref:glycosyltransferase n=1 Tax=Colwellia sp. RSH04 TaxID=2305464 RepID=UPI0015F843A0|nr:glycosyltransferase [Colwellia sp. RSH04]